MCSFKKHTLTDHSASKRSHHLISDLIRGIAEIYWTWTDKRTMCYLWICYINSCLYNMQYYLTEKPSNHTLTPINKEGFSQVMLLGIVIRNKLQTWYLVSLNDLLISYLTFYSGKHLLNVNTVHLSSPKRIPRAQFMTPTDPIPWPQWMAPSQVI